MLNKKEIKLIKRAIVNADYTQVENIEIITTDKTIDLFIDGIPEDTHTNKNDFLNMIIDGLKVGATEVDKYHIKQLEELKEV